jgi:SAM-dependent methyltransferase
MISYTRTRVALALLAPNEVPGAVGRCPFCGLTLFVRPERQPGPHGVRCAGCSAGLVQMSIGWALREEIGSLGALDVCELSAHGAVAAYLRRAARSVAVSEYFADAEPGTLRDGIRVEDVQRLTYADASFDLVTHCDVLEHVPDDARALSELKRVLRPGARMLFTVPLHAGARTNERARLRDGLVEHFDAPSYHHDQLRPEGILAFRDYGLDILDRLRAAGFASPRIAAPSARRAWLGTHPVIVASKP